MGTLTYQINKLYLEDLGFGEGTTTQVRGGTTVNLTEINAANMPFDASNTLQEVLDASYAMIEVVGTNIADVNATAANITEIIQVASDSTNINIVGSNIADVSTVAANIVNMIAVADNNANITLVGASIGSINTVAANIADINTIVTNIVDIQNAEENATLAVNSAANAAASEVLSEKWATEAEDIPVEIGKYSAKHWATKAASIVANGALLQANNLDDLGNVTVARTNLGLDEDVAAIQANSQAIANLATGQGSIENSTTPVFAAIATTATQMPFTVNISSTNSSLFTFNDTNDTITFLSNINYNFLSIVNFKSNTNSLVNITFNLINVADNSVISTQTAPVQIANNDSVAMPMNTLLTIGSNGTPGFPLTVRIEAIADAIGYELTSFTSTLFSGSVTPYVTTTPVLSFSSSVNEGSTGNIITISNYDSLATYTFGTNVGTINYVSGSTATFDAKDITNNIDNIGAITCTATKAGELRSELASDAITITYVPIVADTAYQVVDFTGQASLNDGFDLI